MEAVFPSVPPLRPTRPRLLVALGLASVFVASALSLFAGLTYYTAKGIPDGHEPLAVIIEQPEAGPRSVSVDRNEVVAVAADRESPHDEPTPAAERPADRVTAPVVVKEQVVRSKTQRDWHTMARSAAKETLDNEIRQDAARASLWRQTPSVMFKPKAETAFELEPLMAAVRFIPRAHVFGLGLNIGSCFFGIPLAGIPVEDRGPGPTLIYCVQGTD